MRTHRIRADPNREAQPRVEQEPACLHYATVSLHFSGACVPGRRVVLDPRYFVRILKKRCNCGSELEELVLFLFGHLDVIILCISQRCMLLFGPSAEDPVAGIPRPSRESLVSLCGVSAPQHFPSRTVFKWEHKVLRTRGQKK